MFIELNACVADTSNRPHPPTYLLSTSPSCSGLVAVVAPCQGCRGGNCCGSRRWRIGEGLQHALCCRNPPIEVRGGLVPNYCRNLCLARQPHLGPQPLLFPVVQVPDENVLQPISLRARMHPFGHLPLPPRTRCVPSIQPAHRIPVADAELNPTDVSQQLDSGPLPNGILIALWHCRVGCAHSCVKGYRLTIAATAANRAADQTLQRRRFSIVNS